ncbi:DMT family transporter [Actinophytocola glycyrrhizae]|uniref:DMT family transporter n=1 Tax=Actinophytocola glycyrrhizae TaxID=2044873 RepID=A0ABV9RXF6_9PSEU
MGLLALFWGSSFLWIKMGLASFTPVQMTFIRLVLGASVLVALCWGGRRGLPRDRRLWGHLAVAALIGNAIPFTLFGVGQQTVDSGVAGVINATTPLWVLLIAIVLRSERNLSATKIGGLVLGFLGTLLIFSPWEAEIAGWGALLILVAAVCYAISFAYIGRFVSGRGVGPIALSASQILAATGLMALALPVAGFTPIHLRWDAAIAVVVLGIFGTGFAFALNYRLITDEGPTNAATVGYLLPVVSVLLGALFLGEALTPHVLVGMAVVLGGVALTRVRRRRIPAPPPVVAVSRP